MTASVTAFVSVADVRSREERDERLIGVIQLRLRNDRVGFQPRTCGLKGVRRLAPFTGISSNVAAFPETFPHAQCVNMGDSRWEFAHILAHSATTFRSLGRVTGGNGSKGSWAPPPPSQAPRIPLPMKDSGHRREQKAGSAPLRGLCFEWSDLSNPI